MTTHKNSCPISVSQRGEWAASINPECNCKPLSKCCNSEIVNYRCAKCGEMANPTTPKEEKECCYSFSRSGVHSFNCPTRKEKIVISTTSPAKKSEDRCWSGDDPKGHKCSAIHCNHCGKCPANRQDNLESSPAPEELKENWEERLRDSLDYCREQNGRPDCKNCGLEENDIQLVESQIQKAEKAERERILAGIEEIENDIKSVEKKYRPENKDQIDGMFAIKLLINKVKSLILWKGV